MSMCVHIHSMQSPETRHLEALTELYLHSNNLTQLPSGRPAMEGLVSHSWKGPGYARLGGMDVSTIQT